MKLTPNPFLAIVTVVLAAENVTKEWEHMPRKRKSSVTASAKKFPRLKESEFQLAKLPARNHEARNRVLKALSDMRRGETISKAARENGVTPRTIKRYAGSALVQDRPGGRIRATKSDRLVRYLQIPGPGGAREITVRGSRAASKLASYKADINRLLRGDRNAMTRWHGKKIAGVELITDPKDLVEQARKDILPYSLYRSLAGGAA